MDCVLNIVKWRPTCVETIKMASSWFFLPLIFFSLKEVFFLWEMATNRGLNKKIRKKFFVALQLGANFQLLASKTYFLKFHRYWIGFFFLGLRFGATFLPFGFKNSFFLNSTTIELKELKPSIFFFLIFTISLKIPRIVSWMKYDSFINKSRCFQLAKTWKIL